MRRVYVKPGEVHWSVGPCLFKTVLGSCISVCLWDTARAMGGLNHFVLPHARRGEHDDARFGDVAIPSLIEALHRQGCGSLVAKVFGGAAVMHNVGSETVGDSNAALAIALLGHHHIPIVARRTGGPVGIVLQYHSGNSEARLRVITSDVIDSPWQVERKGRQAVLF